MSSYFFDKKQVQVLIASDHAGFEHKQCMIASLASALPQVVDKGTNSSARCDYPDYAKLVARLVSENVHKALGILLCGSANGVAITANRYAYVRAAVCWNEEITLLARKHNNANIICLPTRFVSKELARLLVQVFLTTSFEGGRHQKRIQKIDSLP